MKKFFYLTIVLAVVSLSSQSCKKKSDTVANCTTLITNISNTGNAYTSDPSAVNCAAYRDAIMAIMGTECSSTDADLF